MEFWGVSIKWKRGGGGAQMGPILEGMYFKIRIVVQGIWTDDVTLGVDITLRSEIGDLCTRVM